MKFSNMLFIAVIVIGYLSDLPDADTDANQKVIYQETFSSDPHWQTNNPSSDYWDPNKGACTILAFRQVPELCLHPGEL